MKCVKCKKDLPESAFYSSHIKHGMHTCKSCLKPKNKEWALNSILRKECESNFERFYGGIKINITNYPQAFEIVRTNGKYFLTKDKNKFIEKLLDILK